MNRVASFLIAASLSLVWGTHNARAADIPVSSHAPLAYHPGFTCPRPDASDPLSSAICGDQAMARAELVLEKTYYAHRAMDGAGAYPALRKQAVAYDKALRTTCAIAPPGPAGSTAATLTSDQKSCYVRTTMQQSSDWARTLAGAFAMEAKRDLDLHMALQQKLIDASYLRVPSGHQADGIYGDSTREAIKWWQESHGDAKTGAISNDQVPSIQKLGVSRAVRWANGGPEPSRSDDPSAPPLERIFQNDMFGIQRQFLEKITGPAKYDGSSPDGHATHTYIVQGCEVVAYEKNGKIDGYQLKVSSSCSVSLTPFIQMSTPTLSMMTLGDVGAALMGASPVADCLTSCGNAADPYVGIRHTGSHAEDYINIEAFAPVLGDKSGDAWSSWADAIRASESDDYLVKATFNCDGKYDAIGMKAVSDVPVGIVYVGTGTSSIGAGIDDMCQTFSSPGQSSTGTSGPGMKIAGGFTPPISGTPPREAKDGPFGLKLGMPISSLNIIKAAPGVTGVYEVKVKKPYPYFTHYYVLASKTRGVCRIQGVTDSFIGDQTGSVARGQFGVISQALVSKYGAPLRIVDKGPEGETRPPEFWSMDVMNGTRHFAETWIIPEADSEANHIAGIALSISAGSSSQTQIDAMYDSIDYTACQSSIAGEASNTL